MDAASSKTAILIFAAVVVVYGILGWLDVKNYAQGGWATAPDNTVTQVLSGSPAEAGGLQVGDKIVSLGGIATTDAAAQAQRGRPAVGETWEFVVERDGATVSLDVTFGEPVPERKFLAHAGFLVGFCFIIFTVRAFMQEQTASTQALALAGVLFSFIFITGPYFGSPMLRSLDNAVTVLLIWLGVASLLNFLLTHLRSGGNKLVYAPGLAVGLFVAWRVLAQPEATDGLNNFTSAFVGVVAAFYLIASLVTVYRSYAGATGSEREASGLQLMMIGAVVGLLLPIITIVAGIVAPQLVLPGQNFYFLTFIAIPITWSMAVLKKSSAPASVD
jgi:hypothetical protein